MCREQPRRCEEKIPARGRTPSPREHGTEREGRSSLGHGAGASLAVQGFRLHTSNAEGSGSIPGQGTKTPHATLRGQKVEEKKRTRG